MLTKSIKSGKILKLSQSDGDITKNLKKVKKTLKKVLTKGNDCDIITKLSAKRGSETVIEN